LEIGGTKHADSASDPSLRRFSAQFVMNCFGRMVLVVRMHHGVLRRREHYLVVIRALPPCARGSSWMVAQIATGALAGARPPGRAAAFLMSCHDTQYG